MERLRDGMVGRWGGVRWHRADGRKVGFKMREGKGTEYRGIGCIEGVVRWIL